jgi:hypothetical protein
LVWQSASRIMRENISRIEMERTWQVQPDMPVWTLIKE